jgi:multisubunit Na+/H+ antiporter MnhB subunit
MAGAEFTMDVLLALALLVTSGFLLTSGNFLRAGVLFIAFGLFMSLAWVRLMAPDIALAEAAIGAGITGVLLIDAIRHMEWERRAWGGKWAGYPEIGTRPSLLTKGGSAAGLSVLAALLLAGVAELPGRRPGLAALVASEMEALEHPVTAVLLVFRGLDTWLELGVLVLAVIGMLAVRARRGLHARSLTPPRDPVLEGVVRSLAPIAVLTAAYLLWLGTFSAGGAFQSGVVLGATGVLLWLSGHASIDALPERVWRMLVLVGFASFTLAALITGFVSASVLEFPEALKLEIVKLIEVSASVSIGACFAALFVGQHPGRNIFEKRRTDENEEEGRGIDAG